MLHSRTFRRSYLMNNFCIMLRCIFKNIYNSHDRLEYMYLYSYISFGDSLHVLLKNLQGYHFLWHTVVSAVLSELRSSPMTDDIQTTHGDNSRTLLCGLIMSVAFTHPCLWLKMKEFYTKCKCPPMIYVSKFIFPVFTDCCTLKHLYVKR